MRADPNLCSSSRNPEGVPESSGSLLRIEISSSRGKAELLEQEIIDGLVDGGDSQ